MELLLRVSFCLLTFFGKTFGDVIGTKEGMNVTLNCSQPTMDLRDKVFDWKRDGQEVFFYGNGKHYKNGKEGQHSNFKDRVEFFEDKLQFGNASISIINTKVTDSGNYSCGFPAPSVVNHTLVVDWILTDRSKGDRNGAFAKPAVTTDNHALGWALLKCKVFNAYPEPSVVWCDSAGNNVSKNKVDYPGKDGHHNIILYANVTKTDNYTCIAKQATLHHESKESTHIYIAGPNSRAEGKKTIKFILLLLLVVVDLLLP